jgi:hypothetical protein
MKKLAAITTVLLLILGAQPANAAVKVKVANSSKISTKTGLVSISVTGLPKEHGIYISQCMGNKRAICVQPCKSFKVVGFKCSCRSKNGS